MHLKHASILEVGELMTVLTYSARLSDCSWTKQLNDLSNSKNKALLYFCRVSFHTVDCMWHTKQTATLTDELHAGKSLQKLIVAAQFVKKTAESDINYRLMLHFITQAFTSDSLQSIYSSPLLHVSTTEYGHLQGATNFIVLYSNMLTPCSLTDVQSLSAFFFCQCTRLLLFSCQTLISSYKIILLITSTCRVHQHQKSFSGIYGSIYCRIKLWRTNRLRTHAVRYCTLHYTHLQSITWKNELICVTLCDTSKEVWHFMHQPSQSRPGHFWMHDLSVIIWNLVLWLFKSEE
jgi:hypothetical protein